MHFLKTKFLWDLLPLGASKRLPRVRKTKFHVNLIVVDHFLKIIVLFSQKWCTTYTFSIQVLLSAAAKSKIHDICSYLLFMIFCPKIDIETITHLKRSVSHEFWANKGFDVVLSRSMKNRAFNVIFNFFFLKKMIFACNCWALKGSYYHNSFWILEKFL